MLDENKMITNKKKYPFPECLGDQCHPHDFEKWLEQKARAHLKRDRGRGNSNATRETYKTLIYEAVVRSKGLDAYTGKKLRWDLISKYDNDEAKSNGKKYKKQFGDLPTVDHVENGYASLQFNICSWRVNDAKNDLTMDEFLIVCKEVLNYNE